MYISDVLIFFVPGLTIENTVIRKKSLFSDPMSGDLSLMCKENVKGPRAVPSEKHENTLETRLIKHNLPQDSHDWSS